MAEGKRTAVLLDGQVFWLDAVARALAPEGIEAVAELREPAQALAALAEHEPDLFVLDPSTSDGSLDGLACMRRARERLPSLRMIAFSASEEPDAVGAAFAAGASLYIPKRPTATALAAAGEAPDLRETRALG